MNKNMFKDFFKSEKSGGIILFFCTFISIIATNLFFGASYINFLHHKINLSVFNFFFGFSLIHLINDGLMTIFFLLVGLEIERELYIGELARLKKALLPIIAAIGGMIVPALIHFIFNHGTASQNGFGIPMATDIAFSLGIISLFGKKIPTTLKIFVTAFAIIDDLGAVIIIALFYTKSITLLYLLLAFLIIIILFILNRLRIHKIAPYVFLGIILWFFMLKSGLHATISGLILAFTIPFTKDDANPSSKVQRLLHFPITYIVLPLFAVANTAIFINLKDLSNIFTSNSIGIFIGLMIGKPVGIFFFSLIAISLGICSLPSEIKLKHILGAGMLGGIGFTMSIFITNLAFTSVQEINASIFIIIISSIISGLIGFIYFKIINANPMNTL